MLEWIPQLFYDLLARVFPGGILIFSTAIVVNGPSEFWTKLTTGYWAGLDTAGVIALVLAAGYIVGFLFGEIWDCMQRFIQYLCGRKSGATDPLELLNWCLKEHHRAEHIRDAAQTCIAEEKEEDCKLTKKEAPALASIRDLLRMEAKSEVSLLLTKLRSEKRLCEVLVLGFAGLSALQFFLPGSDLTWERGYLEIFLIIGSVTCWGKSRSLRRFSLTCAFNSLLCTRTQKHANAGGGGAVP